MTRVGPNQNINDPTTIVGTAYEYQQQSNSIGDLSARTLNNPDATGPPIIDISIPLKMENGTTQLLQGSDINLVDGEYIYDKNLVSRATLVTYVNLAERFRDYFETFGDALSALSDSEDLNNTDVPPITPIIEPIGGFAISTSGSYGGKIFNERSLVFGKSIPDTPVWLGDGPTNYNFGTYPQLLEINSQTGGVSFYSESEAQEIYAWYTIEGSERGAASQGSKIVAISAMSHSAPDLFGLGGDADLIEIPNFSDSAKTIDISATSSYTRIYSSGTSFTTEFVVIALVSGIGNIGSVESASTRLNYTIDFVEDQFGDVDLGISLDESIDIPPNKSAFISIKAISRASRLNTDPNIPFSLESESHVEINGGNISVPGVDASDSLSYEPG
jgi:hypothetical protein